MDDNFIKDLFQDWNRALQSGNPKNVVKLYSSDAILLPTVSNIVRHNQREIEDYFIGFLEKRPKFELEESNIRLFNTLAIHSGRYSASFKEDSRVMARFTFVYQYISKRWLIIEHHSSVMPEL